MFDVCMSMKFKLSFQLCNSSLDLIVASTETNIGEIVTMHFITYWNYILFSHQ